MFDLTTLVEKSKRSSFYLKVLNWFLARMIPFNRPHQFRIVEIDDYRIMGLIPFRKSNFNHISGLHACALATLSEFTTGFLLLTCLEQGKYRIILQRLEMDYQYQGKLNASAEFNISKEWLEEKIFSPLRDSESVVVPCEIKIIDANQNQLTKGLVYWQIKEWAKVRTKA